MARNYHKPNDFDQEDDNYPVRGYYEELKQRRQMKRMKSALKTRNIDILSEFDDD